MATTKWAVDPTHSEILFKVKHLMITTVTGHFKKFDVSAETEGEDFSKAQINFSADLDSISTNNADRDAHLKSGDFFDAASHPKLSFESTEIKKLDEENFTVNGNLTIRDTTKPVVFNVDFGGIIKDPWGQTKAGFTINGKINRKDFGLTWSAVTETGGLVVSDEVRLQGEVQLVQQAA